MTGLPMTRRALLGFAVGAAIAASAWGVTRWDELTREQQKSLMLMARRVYPHDDLANTVYADVLAPFFDRLADDPELTATVHEGVVALNDATGGDWLAANVNDQVAALQHIESTSFFATLQEAVRFELYVHPAVWVLIGYPGSSVEHGGYVARGFDDIDWLPDDTS